MFIKIVKLSHHTPKAELKVYGIVCLAFDLITKQVLVQSETDMFQDLTKAVSLKLSTFGHKYCSKGGFQA